MANLSTILHMRKRYREKHNLSTNVENMSGVEHNKDIEEIEDKYWVEAKRMCEAIRAGRHIAGKQAIGSILAD